MFPEAEISRTVFLTWVGDIHTEPAALGQLGRD